tara:strand:+ start:806 stop:1279 length:474 start_codon:yes stop_codon:yes gene_type:complete
MIKIGQGYDSHRFKNGEYVIIGGVKIKSKKSVVAHSDGDVLIHAICDALLGAAGKGDMGFYFNSSEKFKDMDSAFFLKEIMSIIRDDGCEIGNIDATIVTEEPPISKHAQEIEKNLCKIIKINEDQINIKSKSNDKLGYLGRHEGIEAHVSVLLKKL